ncbi:golgi complex component Cog3, partial [Rhizodiscina lignyota]
DAWYSSLVPRAASGAKKVQHKRRESLLKQPEGSQADIPAVEDIAEDVDDPGISKGPPKATVARRAKSYSDFYEVVRAHIKKERQQYLEKEKKRKTREQLQTEADFERWYSGISQDLLDAGHEEYRVYRDQLRLTENHLDTLQDNTISTLELLSSLSDAFKAVEAQTSTFRAQCEGLLQDQKRITTLADEIGENLQYYAYLDPITRRLNAPGAGNFVRGREFSEMLSNLDACIEYMQSHPNQREAANYRSRYRLLLTRALTLIRVHFTNSLREIAADVSRRIADRQLNDTTMSALLYAKFRVPAAELKQTGLEIAKRAVPPPGAEAGAEAEYQSLMNELYQSYSTTRGRLILPLITKKMTEISMAPSSSKDLVSFARTAISYVRGICFDEYDLWREWFDDEGGLYDFLEAMCEPLYDHLRPRTIHETQLLKLCELCTLIQTRYMEDEDEDEEDLDISRLDFAALIHPALEDAQARLIFLSLAVLRNDIENYKPKPEDLNYPARTRRSSVATSKGNQPVLSGRKGSNVPRTPVPNTPQVVEEDGVDSAFTFHPKNQDWYPPLRKAVWLLSRIYRLVNSVIFDDLAHQIVHQTTLSIVTASNLISKSASPTDGNLFLLKHLLLLKQQIVAFDIEFVSADVNIDFNSFTATFFELRERGGLFDPRNWGRWLVPRVVRDMRDAKGELDGRLRNVINEFTQSVADRMTASLPKSDPANPPAGQKKGKQIDPRAATEEVRKQIEKDVPFLRKKLEEYIEDMRTRETLVAAVMDVTVQAYEDWYQRHHAGAKKGKGKGREDEVWDPDVFSEWCTGVFGVG